VKQVVEPVNTTRKGRALFERSEFCKGPEEYLQALDLRNLSFSNIFLYLIFLIDKLIHMNYNNLSSSNL